jgi:hypothetical protein
MRATIRTEIITITRWRRAVTPTQQAERTHRRR